ncbi:MAG TPA: hypothetical protein VK574_17145 [Terracidiphilus sp.]|nr:hypothetical protein [Terracidiphilus sp.]
MTDMKTTEAVAQVVTLLTPFESVERHRVIQASLMLLGETPPILGRQGAGVDNEADDDGSNPMQSVHARARTWMKQNDVSADALQQVFHFDNGAAEFIAGEIVGSNNKEKTCNAYIIVGLSAFLATGNATFDDKAGRLLCESSGCYDGGNHAYYIKNKGNEFTGTKEKGWTLTAPGLKRAATLIKEIAGV